MNNFTVESLGTKIYINSEVDLFCLFQNMKIFSHLPDMKLSKEPTINDNYNINYCDNNLRKFCYDGFNASVEYPIDEINNGHSLIYISGPLIEKQRQEKYNLTCHASCLSKDGEAVLLLGPKGSGKTSMALQLLSNGYSLISNDICVIDYSEKDKIYALGGTKFLNVRKNVAKNEVPSLVEDMEYNSDFKLSNSYILDPRKIGFSIEKRRTPITTAYILNINNNFEKLTEVSGNELTTKLYLAEDFSRYIRGTSFYFINSKLGNVEGYIPSFDNEELCRERQNFINFLISEFGMSKLNGNSKDVKQFLLKK